MFPHPGARPLPVGSPWAGIRAVAHRLSARVVEPSKRPGCKTPPPASMRARRPLSRVRLARDDVQASADDRFTPARATQCASVRRDRHRQAWHVGKPGPLQSPGSLKVGDVRAWIVPLGWGTLLTWRTQVDEAKDVLLSREAHGSTALRGA